MSLKDREEALNKLVAIQNENTELRLSVRVLETKQNSLEADVEALKQALQSRNDRFSSKSPETSGYSTLNTPGSTIGRTQQESFITDLEQKLSLRMIQ